MKRYIWGMSVIVLVFVAAAAWHIYSDTIHPDKILQASTGINNFSIVKMKQEDDAMYIKVNISEANGNSLLKRYPFKIGYSSKAIAGKAQQDYIKDCNTCWCYVNDKDLGQYAYKLFCISADKKQLEIYENFGD